MALIYADRVKETASNKPNGATAFNLPDTGATGYRSFDSVLASTDTCIYGAENGTDWEVGIGTFTAGAPDTLTRTTILSSSTGSAIDWSAGADVSVYITWDASRASRSTNKGSVIVKNATSTTQSITQTTWTKLSTVLDDEVLDTNGWWDSTNKKFVPTIPGRYLITCSAQLAAIVSDKIVQATIYKNGSANAYGGVFEGRSGVISVLVESDGNDEFEFYLFHNDTTARSTESEAARVWFMAYMVEAT